MASSTGSGYAPIKGPDSPDLELLPEGEKTEEAAAVRPVERYLNRTAFGCAACCGSYLILVVLFSLIVYCCFPVPDTCAVEDDVVTPLAAPYPLHVGTAANILDNHAWPVSEIDLTGLWWLRWDDSNGFPISFYNSLRLEIAVTFAHSRVMINDEYVDSLDPDGLNATHYPFDLKVFGQQQNHWGYSDFLPSWTLQMFGHWLAWPIDTAITFRFYNSSYADVVGIGPFIKQNEDEWLRPTNLFIDTYTYTLTRIVDADGAPHPTWGPQFEEFMSGHKLRVWGNEDECGRRCELSAMLFGSTKYIACKWCAFRCGYDGYAATDHEE